MAGINGILFYAKQLFEKITNGEALVVKYLLVGLAIMQIISTLISSKIVDKKGRKPMLLNGYLILIGILLGIFVSDKLIEALSKNLG